MCTKNMYIQLLWLFPLYNIGWRFRWRYDVIINSDCSEHASVQCGCIQCCYDNNIQLCVLSGWGQKTKVRAEEVSTHSLSFLMCLLFDSSYTHCTIIIIGHPNPMAYSSVMCTPLLCRPILRWATVLSWTVFQSHAALKLIKRWGCYLRQIMYF